MRSFIQSRSASVIMAMAAVGTAGSAVNAAVIAVPNFADTLTNSFNDTIKNTARNSDTSLNALNNSTTKSQVWAKFSGADLRIAIGTGSIDSLALRLGGSFVDSNSTVQFYFNSNADWTLPASGTNAAGQDPATTPYLTYNTSGQIGSANGRFLGTTQLMATLNITNSRDVVAHMVDIPLTTNSMLRDAIASGTDFTVFMNVVGNGRLSVLASEGVQGYQDAAFFGTQTAAPLTIVANTSAVPEPAAMSLLGLAGTTLLIRRRR